MDDTKENIQNFALAAFADRGYNAVGTQEICEAAGVTKPTLYYHFGSKLGILESIADSHFEPFLGDLWKGTRWNGDLAGILTSIFLYLLESARSQPAFTRLRLSINFAPAASEEFKIFRPFSLRVFEMIQGVFLAAEQIHGNMKGRSAHYATSFLGMADAHTGSLLASSSDYEEESVRRLVHYFMHGLFS